MIPCADECRAIARSLPTGGPVQKPTAAAFDALARLDDVARERKMARDGKPQARR